MAKNGERRSQFPGLTDKLKATATDTQEYTPTHTYTHTPKVKEKRNARANLLMKPSVKKALTEYAELHDTSMNDIINTLVEEFLKENS